MATMFTSPCLPCLLSHYQWPRKDERERLLEVSLNLMKSLESLSPIRTFSSLSRARWLAFLPNFTGPSSQGMTACLCQHHCQLYWLPSLSVITYYSPIWRSPTNLGICWLPHPLEQFAIHQYLLLVLMIRGRKLASTTQDKYG